MYASAAGKFLVSDINTLTGIPNSLVGSARARISWSSLPATEAGSAARPPATGAITARRRSNATNSPASSAVTQCFRATRGRRSTSASSAGNGSLVMSVNLRASRAAGTMAGVPDRFSRAETQTLVSTTARTMGLPNLLSGCGDIGLDLLWHHVHTA
jgi:hypothetical protein